MNIKLRLLVTAAMFAALTAALTFFVKIPAGNGYIHAGDSIIYLAACILPFPYALVSAAVGGAFADGLGGYAAYIIPTLIIKALITLPYSSSDTRILTRRNLLMTIPAGLITVAGYYIAGVIIFGELGALVSMAGDTVQALGSAVMFTAVAAAFDKIGMKQRILTQTVRRM